MTSSPLDSVVQQLWHIVLLIGIVAVVIGTVAGLAVRGFEDWFVRSLRGLLRSSGGHRGYFHDYSADCTTLSRVQLHHGGAAGH